MKDLVLERVFTVWAFGLTAILIVATAIAIFNLATGNFHSTASFEF